MTLSEWCFLTKWFFHVHINQQLTTISGRSSGRIIVLSDRRLFIKNNGLACVLETGKKYHALPDPHLWLWKNAQVRALLCTKTGHEKWCEQTSIFFALPA
jgi:hypothetical protein